MDTTKVEPGDLEWIRIPRLEQLDTATLSALAEITDALAAEMDQRAISAALKRLDGILAGVIGLSGSDRELLLDADRRARAIFFETPAARRSMEATLTTVEVRAYANNLCSVFNAFATDDDDLVLVPDLYSARQGDLMIVRFRLLERGCGPRPDLRLADLPELGETPLDALGGADLPYLKPAKSLRLYGETTVYVLKPAHYRYFSPAAGQSDGDRIIADLMEPEPESRAVVADT